MNLVIFGDGNFSFSQCLVKRYKKDPEFVLDWLGITDSYISKLKTCSLDSFLEIIRKYPEFKDYKWPDWVEIDHDINALDLSDSFKDYDLYIWNHPHVGIEDLNLHSKLLIDFFSSMKKLNAKKVLVSLIQGQFERWDVLNSANSNNFILSSTRVISETDFIDWKAVRNTSGKSFKNNPTISRSSSRISTRFIFSLGEDLDSQISFIDSGFSRLGLDKEKCQKCEKSFNSKRGLKQHDHMVHVLKKFGSDWSFKGPLKFKCDKCNRDFKAKIDLETHLKAIHLKLEEKVSGKNCPKCCRDFTMERDLIQHLRYVHL